MQGNIICLDIEATGLDFENDAIIEIAAVRFNQEDGIIEEFHTMIDPGIPIPERITILTGINDEDVTGAPTMRAIAKDFSDFLGDDPILGHKVNTDIAYLSPYNIATDNPQVDTYELAAILMPTAPRYSLGSLVEQLELEDLNAHRALDDVKATVELYWVLWEELMKLPLDVLKTIVNASLDVEWGAKLPLVNALQIRSKSGLSEKIPSRPLIPFKPSRRRDWKVLQANERRQDLDVDSLASLIEPNGQLSHSIPNYESRQPQVNMLRRTTDAFNYGEHLMIEAPTGTGKSIAYLIPAIYWSLLNNERVLISTATIALQDQIMNKDLPLLQESLSIEFEAAVAKGRNNYLCPRQLDAMIRRRPTSVDELRVLAKVLIWLQQSDSGDKSEINLRGFAEDMAWFKLSAQDEGCTMNRCETQMAGACPFYKARRKGESAHIIVANHALLLSDVQMGNRVLPDFRYVILDEAHHLEDATTRGLQVKLDRLTLRRRFADIGDEKRGLFSEILKSLKGNVPDTHYNRIAPYIENVSEAVKDMGFHIDAYFKEIMAYLDDTGELGSGDYSTSVRITDAIRESPRWRAVIAAWDNLQEFFSVLSNAMNKIANALEKFYDLDIPNLDDQYNTLVAASRHLNEINEQLDTFTAEGQENTIFWCEVNSTRTYLSLNIAPLHVGPLISEHLWEAKESVILASATLRTDNKFNFIRTRLNATTDEVADFTVRSPFNYEESTMIYIPTDIPEPNMRQEYQGMLERGIIETATLTQGRMLGLFTSYAQLRQTAQAIAPRLALGGISVLDQASGTSRQLLVESFKSTEKAVLLGTRSFWEGIDLPGEDLQVLAIARLPFSVPSDPIFAARSETFDNSFFQYAVPDAILRFRQGFGRLIRRRTDRGVVAIFDKRVVSKRYGKHFLDSLPKCTIIRGPLANLPKATKEWLER